MIPPHNEFTMPLFLDDFSGHQKDGALCLMAQRFSLEVWGKMPLEWLGAQWCLMIRPMNSASCNAKNNSCLRLDKLSFVFPLSFQLMIIGNLVVNMIW